MGVEDAVPFVLHIWCCEDHVFSISTISNHSYWETNWPRWSGPRPLLKQWPAQDTVWSPASFTLYSSDFKYKSQWWRRFRWAKKCHGPWLITPRSNFSVSFFQLMFLFCLVSFYFLSLSSVPICVKLVCLVFSFTFSGLIYLCALFLSSDHFQFSSYSLSVSVFFCQLVFFLFSCSFVTLRTVSSFGDPLSQLMTSIPGPSRYNHHVWLLV